MRPKINLGGEIKSAFDKTLVNNKAINRFALIVLLFSPAIGFACNYAPLKDKKPVPAAVAPENETSSFEHDLQTMRTANFDYVFVFRRKDGGEFDADDRKYLRENRPPEANRFVSTDNGKAFIAGSSYKFSAENLENLGKRFNIEDYSVKKEETNPQTK